MSSKPSGFSLPLPLLLVGALVLLGLAAGVVSLMGPSSTAVPGGGGGGPAVTVAAPVTRAVTDWGDYTGQFTAVDYVEVRARVSGYLTEIHFTDGQQVEKGDLLFVIDPRPYEIALASARAKLDQATGTKEFTRRQLTRADELRRKDFVPESTLDQRTEESRGAGGAVEIARAAVRDAELNLQFTHVTAPVSGRIGARQVSIGNLVSGGANIASPTLLTTIVSQDPIYFSFDMSESEYLIQSHRNQGAPEAGMLGATAQIRLMDEAEWSHQGKIDFIDNQIDRGTGTIHARAVLANPDHSVTPGAFGRVRVAASAPYDAQLVPDAAVITDQSRKLVMTVKDGIVTPKMVTLGPIQDGLRVVRSGIGPEDQIIINGLMLARPGAKVTPQPGKIE